MGLSIGGKPFQSPEQVIVEKQQQQQTEKLVIIGNIRAFINDVTHWARILCLRGWGVGV